MKFFMQSETDLKDLTTQKLVQLIQQFLHEVLEVIPPADILLLENYDAESFSSGALPVQFDRLEETLRITNANLVLYHVLSQLNQHVPFDFEMMIWPQRYEKEWRLIISTMLDFAKFKADMMGMHTEIITKISDNQVVLQQKTQEMDQLIQSKLQLDQTRTQRLQEYQDLQFKLTEDQLQLDQLQSEYAILDMTVDTLAQEEERLLEELEALSREGESLEQTHKETEGMRVSDEEYQAMLAERDLGREEVKLIEEQVKLRLQGLEKLAGIEKEVEQARNQVNDQASQMQSAAELKNLSQIAKRDLKKS